MCLGLCNQLRNAQQTIPRGAGAVQTVSRGEAPTRRGAQLRRVARDTHGRPRARPGCSVLAAPSWPGSVAGTAAASSPRPRRRALVAVQRRRDSRSVLAASAAPRTSSPHPGVGASETSSSPHRPGRTNSSCTSERARGLGAVGTTGSCGRGDKLDGMGPRTTPSCASDGKAGLRRAGAPRYQWWLCGGRDACLGAEHARVAQARDGGGRDACLGAEHARVAQARDGGG